MSPAEGEPPLPRTGPLITSDMWLLKRQCLRPSHFRSRHEAEATGANRAVSGAGRRDRATVPAACSTLVAEGVGGGGGGRGRKGSHCLTCKRGN